MRANGYDLVRHVLSVGGILALLGLSVWVLQPFLGASLWAATLVVATWPLYLRLRAAVGDRRNFASFLMAFGLLLLLVVPLFAAVDTLVSHRGMAMGWWKKVLAEGLPPAPTWLATVPWSGEALVESYSELAAAGTDGLTHRLTPHAGSIGRWLFGEARDIGGLLLEFLMVVLFCGLMYRDGERAADLSRRLGRRLAGARGEEAVLLAGQAVRAVALGVGVTALVQSSLGGLGLWVFDVPFAGLLSALMLMLCIAQVGPSLVLFPAVGWMYWQGRTGAATALLVLSVVVALLDNVLRPVLIRQGADLPLLLIFAGVIGGLLAFGLVGIFVGPVVLAVTYTLMQAWGAEAPAKSEG